MTDLLTAVKNLGSKFGKGFAVELFLEYYEDELIQQFRDILNKGAITREDIMNYVQSNMALPIPPEAFAKMKGIEDYLETISETRVFEWLYKARPDLGEAIIALDDKGIAYVFKFKRFIIDSIRNSGTPLEEEATEESSEEITQEEESPQPTIIGGIKYVGETPAKEARRVESKKSKEPEKTKKLVCSECGHERLATPEEAEVWVNEPCPECGK